MTRSRAAPIVLVVLVLAGVIACWLSSGWKPVTDAVRGQRAPADFIRDYVTARARLDSGRGPPPSGESANDLGERLGTPRVLLLGGPYYLHPPPALLPLLPIAWLPFRAAALIWTALSLGALVWLAVSLLGIAAPQLARGAGRPGRRRVVGVALLATALALWPPSLHCLEKGQWSICVAALLAAGYRALEGARPGRAGVLFGIAAAIKATPALLLVMLLGRNRRAALTMLLTGAAASLLALAIDGIGFWTSFARDARHDAEVWATWIANTASLDGVLARLFTRGYFSRPLVAAPLVAQVTFAVVVVGALAAAVVTWPRRPAPVGLGADTDGSVSSERAMSLWCAAWLTLPVVINPLGWTHVVVTLLAPMAIAFRDGGTGTRIGTLIVLAVLSIPRQRLMAWAGPLPVPPGRGLVLGAHAVASIALYVMLLGDSVRARRGAGFASALRDRHFRADPRL